MSYVGEIRRLAECVAAGTLSASDATHRAVQFTEGRITRMGAAEMMERTVRELSADPPVFASMVDWEQYWFGTP